jgi:hypothetical protein
MNWVFDKKKKPGNAGISKIDKTGSHQKERFVQKVELKIEKADLVYSPVSDFNQIIIPDENDRQRKNWKIYDKAIFFYSKKFFKKAKEEFLKIDRWYHTSQCYNIYLLRTYRKLIDGFIEKGKKKEALAEMDEMFEICGNTTNYDIRKYNKIARLLKESSPAFNAEEKELIVDFETEFTVDCRLIKFVSEYTKSKDFKIVNNDGFDSLKAQNLSHFLPGSLPYIFFNKAAIEYIVPEENPTLAHDVLSFKESANQKAFILCSSDLNLFIYNWDFQQLLSYDISKYTNNCYEIKCVDVSANLSCFLFTIRSKVFVLDNSSNPKIIFSCKAPDIKDLMGYSFICKEENEIAGTGFSPDSSRIYLGCSSGKIFQLNRNGEILNVYTLPPELKKNYFSPDSTSHIIEQQDYLHIKMNSDICIIKDGKLISIIKFSRGTIKWFSLGFIHLVDNIVYFYSNAGSPYAVLKFKQEIRHICCNDNHFLIDTDRKSFVFRLNENKCVFDDSNEKSTIKIESVTPVAVHDDAVIDVNCSDIPIHYTDNELYYTEETEMDSLEGVKTVEDYVKLAEAVIVDLKDERNAREIYQQAEIRARRLDDWVKLAESVYENLLDRDYTEEIIDKALKNSNFIYSFEKIKTYLRLVEFIIERLEKEDLAKIALEKACGCADHPWEFIHLAESILNHLRDEKWAKLIYRKVERTIHYYSNYIDLAESIFKNLQDIEWVKALYRKVENNTNYPGECIRLAESILNHLQDKLWAKVLYKKAELNLYTVWDYIKFAGSLAGVLNDEEWARRVYKNAEEKVKIKDDYVRLAVSILKNLEDEEYAKRIFKEAEVRISNMVSYRSLAESLSEHIEDISFAREVYRRIEEKTRTAVGFIELANLVAKYLSDKEWLKKLYLKAGEKLKNIVELRKLGESMLRNLSDKEFEKKIYVDFLEKSRNTSEYIITADLISTFLNDRGFAQKACKDVDIRFLSKKELEERFETCLERLEGPQPQQKIELLHRFFMGHKINKHIKSIYLEVVPIFLSLDKIEALSAYITYCYLGFKERKPVKPLPEKVMKRIFKDETHYREFFQIIEDLRISKNLEESLSKARLLLVPKIKKIQLNPEEIDKIQTQHSNTVETLNEVLSEGKNIDVPVFHKTASMPGLTFESIFNSSPKGDQTLFSIPFTPIQKDFLKLFPENNFTVSHSAASRFAQTRKFFVNQLINSINEIFVEFFDDVLIEESEENYMLNQEYIKSIQREFEDD